MVGGLLVGAADVLHDGSPTWPDVDGAWRVAALTRADAGRLRRRLPDGRQQRRRLARATASTCPGCASILQTGSTLPDHAWVWTSEHVSRTCSSTRSPAGPTSARRCAGANPLQPVYAGRIPAAELGVALEAWDPDGKPVVEQDGELVVTSRCRRCRCTSGTTRTAGATATATSTCSPASGGTATGSPSTATGRSRSSGRSDSTLNRDGVRMGSAEIYAVVEQLPEVADSLVIGVERPDGAY